MLAQLIDAVRALQYITILANRDPKGKAPNPPEPYPIPDRQRKRDPNKPKVYEPGSFGFIAHKHLAAIKKQRSAPCPEAQEVEK